MQRASLELEKAMLKDKLKEKTSDIAAKVEDNLVDKYCHVEYTSVFRRNRTRALKVTDFDANCEKKSSVRNICWVDVKFSLVYWVCSIGNNNSTAHLME